MDKEVRKNTYIAFLIVIIIVVILGYFKHIELKEHGLYAIGEVTSSLYTNKGARKEIWYKFKIKDKPHNEFRGIYSPFILYRLFLPKINPKKGEKYLVVYSQKNPKNNFLILAKPIKEYLNVDSLNNKGIDTNDINFWER